jgi:hypothetical protein
MVRWQNELNVTRAFAIKNDIFIAYHLALAILKYDTIGEPAPSN